MIQKQNNIHIKLFLVSIFWIAIEFCSMSPARAQAAIGARELAMGNASAALAGTGWAMFGNPALMDQQRYSVAFYGVRYFGFSEISDMAFSMNYPVDAGVIGVGLHRYGFDLFNESRIRFGYKNDISGFHYGAVITYSHVVQGIAGGSAGAVGIDLGIAAEISAGLMFGAKVTNINQPAYGRRNNEELPRDMSVGLSYQMTEGTIVSADVYKDVQFPVSYRGGIEAVIIESFVGRLGISTAPRTFSAGFGYSGSLFNVNVAVQRHQNHILGLSPAVDFQIFW